MAFDLGAAILRLRGDRSELDATLGDTEKSTVSWGERLGGSLKTLLSGALVGVGVAAAGALVVAGGAALNLANDVNASQRDFQAQLGVTQERGEELAQLSKTIWSENWGSDMSEVSATLTDIEQQFVGLGGVGDETAKQLATGAFALRDSFGGETTEYISASKTLMEQFGLTGKEATDFIAKGMQSGLNASGDFLDTIGEYSNLFSAGGADAGQFFSLIESGMGSGVLGTDKAADAFKEFSIRIREMGDDVWGPDGSMTLGLGMSSEEIDRLYNGMQDGSVSVADAFNDLMPRLQGVENEIYRNTIGTQLFGTQWEDLGPKMAAGLDMGTTKLSDMAGATDSLNARYADWGSLWEGFKRQGLAALEPLASQLLDLANSAMPYVSQALNAVIPIITMVVSALMSLGSSGAVGMVIAAFQSLAGDGGAAMGQWSGAFQTASNVIQAVLAAIMALVGAYVGQATAFWQANGTEIMATVQTSFSQVVNIIQTALQLVLAIVVPILTAVAGFISSHGAEIQAILGGVWSVISGLIGAALGVIQGLLTAALAVIRGDWQGAWDGIKTALGAALDGLRTVLTGGLTILQNAFKLGVDAFIELARGVGVNISEGVATGIKNAADKVAQAFDWVVDAAITYVKKMLGIASPSRVAASTIGVPLGEGIAQGIRSTIAATVAVMEELGDDLLDKMRDIGAKANDIAEQMIRSTFSGTSSLKRGEMDTIDDITAFNEAQAKKIADLKEAGVELSATQQSQLEGLRIGVRNQLEEAMRQADEMAKLDPQRAADFLALRRRQILEVAEISETQYLATSEDARAEAYRKYILALQAQEAERALFDQQAADNNQSLIDFVEQLSQTQGVTAPLLGQFQSLIATLQSGTGLTIGTIDARGSMLTLEEIEATFRRLLEQLQIDMRDAANAGVGG